MFDSLRDAVDVVPYEYAHGLVNKDVRNKTGKKSFSGGGEFFDVAVTARKNCLIRSGTPWTSSPTNTHMVWRTKMGAIRRVKNRFLTVFVAGEKVYI